MHPEQEILAYIMTYETIIIHRHQRPDMDAIGSQVGLAHLIKDNFKDKQVFVVGDTNGMTYNAVMDTIDDDMFDGALSIITDVAVSHMVSDDRYTRAKARLIIDHHQNDTDIEDVAFFHRDPTFSSASEMIVRFAKVNKLVISSDAATYLYGGMVTDTGRFMYLSDPARTFSLASHVAKSDPAIQDFYDWLYTEPLAKRKVKNMFSDFEMTPNGVAYRKNTADIVEASGLGFQGVSRGMVNQMAGIKEVPIWANFTEDAERGVIIGEFRARGITIVDIAKAYGGGGHNTACGATLENWDVVDEVIRDLDERAKTT
jgi:bifunctional oligoribonuclease and PAP phosphatase NrnA